MTRIQDSLVDFQPVYRVFDREKNLNFYRDMLGLKVLKEEGAMVELGGFEAKAARLLLEESPRAREVQGTKKHGRTVLLAPAAELGALLAGHFREVEQVFSTAKGWAFEAISPEQDHFLLTSSEDLTSLKPVEKAGLKFEEIADFEGLSDFKVLDLTINVQTQPALESLEEILGSKLCETHLSLKRAEGVDLTAPTAEVRDLEFLLLKVKADLDLAGLAKAFQGDTYLDARAKTLVLYVKDSIEIWLVR